MPGPLTKAILLVLGLSANAASTASAGSVADDAERRARLSRLLVHDCGACHGLHLSGGLGSPLTVEALRGKSTEYLVRVIRNGVDGTAMPGWQALLSEADILWLADAIARGGQLDIGDTAP